MKLVFIYGPPASGKLTIARELAAITGLAVFHNHLVVDAVAAIFPFGTARFTRLREQIWLTMMREAAEAGRSIIFTFAPEPSVATDFPERLRQMVERGGGEIAFVRFTISVPEQERRVALESRAEFGKLRSVELLRELRDAFAACEQTMPAPVLSIDTTAVDPARAAALIAQRLRLPCAPGAEHPERD